MEAAKQASGDNWGHCWHGTASELVTCMGTLSLPSYCKNISSRPWSRNKEGTSPSSVPFCTCVDQHSGQGQEVVGWDPSVWAWCCTSIPSCFCGFCLCWAISAAETAAECTAVLGVVSQTAQLPSQGTWECQTGQEPLWLCSVSASGCPKVLLITKLPYLYVDVLHHIALLWLLSHFFLY